MKLHILLIFVINIFGGNNNFPYLVDATTAEKALKQEDSENRNVKRSLSSQLPLDAALMDSKETVDAAFLRPRTAQTGILTSGDFDYPNNFYDALKYKELRNLENGLLDEQKDINKSAMLLKMLEDPNSDTLPIVYVEEEVIPQISTMDYTEYYNDETFENVLTKRSSLHYPNFPWKRHNRIRGNILPVVQYTCTPTKEDIFKLLLNLQENRKGNQNKSINFCNRQRPPWAILKNIRLLE